MTPEPEAVASALESIGGWPPLTLIVISAVAMFGLATWKHPQAKDKQQEFTDAHLETLMRLLDGTVAHCREDARVTSDAIHDLSDAITGLRIASVEHMGVLTAMVSRMESLAGNMDRISSEFNRRNERVN